MSKKTSKSNKEIITASVSYSYNEQEILMVKESNINHGSWNYSQSTDKDENGQDENKRIQHETVNFSY